MAKGTSSTSTEVDDQISSDLPLCQWIFYNNPDTYPPIVNGARLLAREGWRVEILCRDNGENWGIKYPQNVSVHRINSGSRRDSWAEYLRFIYSAQQHFSSHAVAFFGHDMHGLVAAALKARRYRSPLVYHCHDFAENAQRLPLGSSIVRSIQRRIAPSAQMVIVPDGERGHAISSQLKLRREPIVVANSPLLTPIGSGESLRRDLSNNGAQFSRIIFRQGRIGAGHAIEATLRSIPMWSSQNWGFVIMGPGDPAYIEGLNQMAREMRVSRQFAVLPPVSYDQVFDYTPGADVGHALYEPIHINNACITTASNKILEYMSAELPLLVSERPSLTDFISQHKCGLSADEGDPRSIANAINNILEGGKAKTLGQAGRRAFVSELCYERQYAPVISILNDWFVNSRGHTHKDGMTPFPTAL